MSAHANLEARTATPIMDVAILYEDWGTGVRAKQACEHVAQRVPPEIVFSLDLWRFDLLENEALRSEALQAAAAADLLIVSAHGQRALPHALDAWLQQWLVHRLSEPTGLVLSLDATAQGSAAANDILAGWSELARAAEVDLFLHFGHAPRREQIAFLLERRPRSHSAEGRQPGLH